MGAELTDITAVAPEFRYRETDPSGIVENEICPVFAARITNDVTINEDEVMDWTVSSPDCGWPQTELVQTPGQAFLLKARRVIRHSPFALKSQEENARWC